MGRCWRRLSTQEVSVRALSGQYPLGPSSAALKSSPCAVYAPHFPPNSNKHRIPLERCWTHQMGVQGVLCEPILSYFTTWAWGRRPEAVIRTRPRDGARSLPHLVPSTTPPTSLKLDLPPVVPPPSVAPVLPGPGGPPTRGSPPQQQQRPSLSYFLFLSLLFYLLSNNADQNTLQGDTGALERHEALLLARQGRRDGLASWLGLEVSHNGTVEGNGTAVEPTVFEPTICTNQVLLPALHAMLDRDGGEARHYPMNLTGFVKGSWAPSGYSYDELGLPEVFNSTVLRPSTAAEIAEEDGDPVPPAITPRQALNDTAPLSNTTLVPPRLRNATVTTNRTVSRGSFPWLASPGGSGGKLSFNIHSEQTTVTGPYRGMPTDDGEHLQLREGVPVEEWEREGLVVYMRVSSI